MQEAEVSLRVAINYIKRFLYNSSIGNSKKEG